MRDIERGVIKRQSVCIGLLHPHACTAPFDFHPEFRLCDKRFRMVDAHNQSARQQRFKAMLIKPTNWVVQ